MKKTEVLIVGGGPAGAACAWQLKQNNIDCMILDQAQFPRFKPCAGWITPEVLRDLQMDVSDYPYGLTSFSQFDISLAGIHFKLRTRQYSIRRFEFDHWLLQRSGAAVDSHRVKEIVMNGQEFVIDGGYTAHYLVGAGGTHCPVYHQLFKPCLSNPKKSLIVAQEEEFQYDAADDRCRLWFFENKLPGYSWYVPKLNGYVNVGVGGSAAQLKANGDSLKHHWNMLVEKLEQQGLIREHAYKPSGHSYYLREKSTEIRRGNAFLTGDALGLATLDMGEGIGPAIQSGLLAAEAISKDIPYRVDSIPRYSFPSLLKWRR
jgi:flavin-dependent dehydrogenase